MIDYKALSISLLLALIVILGINLYHNNTCECSCKTNMVECSQEVKTIEVVKVVEKECNCYEEALIDVKESNKFLDDIKKAR